MKFSCSNIINTKCNRKVNADCRNDDEEIQNRQRQLNECRGSLYAYNTRSLHIAICCSSKFESVACFILLFFAFIRYAFFCCFYSVCMLCSHFDVQFSLSLFVLFHIRCSWPLKNNAPYCVLVIFSAFDAATAIWTMFLIFFFSLCFQVLLSSM